MMKKYLKHDLHILLVVLVATTFFRCNSTQKETNTASEIPVAGEQLNHIFKNGEDGYTCYRIPAIVRSTHGTLLAFAEGRKKGCSDTGDIDLLLKRSEDNGKTWSGLQVVWNDGENTCGNPAPVVDRETGEVILLSTWNLGSDHEKEIISGESEDTRRVFITSSSDDGANWKEMKDITESVKLKNWAWYATGPCSGIQLTSEKYKGRLVIPADHIETGAKKALSHVIYSDDHGKTWKIGGLSPIEKTNESTVAELSSGKLMLNMRNYDREKRNRQVVISEDGGESWKNGYADSTLIEPICQASLISHSVPGENAPYLVFSNPASTKKRIKQTVRLSKDDGKTWFASKTIHEGPTAYSNLISLPDGSIGILYEAGLEKPYEGIAFQVLSLNDF